MVLREYLLVDGHSVIFGWPDLRALHGRRMMAARDALIKRLTAYQDQTGVRVVVIFDGQGAQVTEDTETGGIQIFYAPGDRTADEILERLVAKYGTTHRITVASSDNMVQQTAITFGAASCLSVEQLKGMLEGVERDFSKQLRNYRRS